MSDIRFPRPLRAGDTIAVTAPSSGVPAALRPRLDAAVDGLRSRGFEVVIGRCIDAGGPTSAPARERAAELSDMLCDPDVAAVVPPWGGELAIDVLAHLDWGALCAAEPTWFVGWSDISTLLLPVTLRLGWATVHGWNLMDTPYAPPPGLRHWIDLVRTTGEVAQSSPGRTRDGWDDWVADPTVSTMTLDRDSSWTVLGGGSVDVTGRLVGGCLEVVSPLAGTPFGDVPAFGRAHQDEGLIVYLEACEEGAYAVARMLHGLRLAGWFDHANAVLIGHTPAPDAADLTQHEAVLDALGPLDVPVVLDVEIGHKQPYLPLVNGAPARVVVDGSRHDVVQTLGS